MNNIDRTHWFTSNIVNTDAISYMTKQISISIERKMNATEIRTFIQFVRENKTANWNLYVKQFGEDGSIKEIMKLLIKNYIIKEYMPKGRNNFRRNHTTIDVHEVMKNYLGTPDQDIDLNSLSLVDETGAPSNVSIHPQLELEEENNVLGSIDEIRIINNINNLKSLDNIHRIMGVGDPVGLKLLFNPEAAYKKNYIIMDTRHRLTDSDGTLEQSWNFFSNSAVGAIGAVNSLGNIKNIVSISVPKIRIPYKDSVILNGYNRVSLLIKELSGQSHVAHETRRFHFMFDAVPNGNAIDLTPLRYGNSEGGIYKFIKPITQLTRLTCIWGNPLEPIIFDKDRLVFTISYTNPASFTVTSGENHNLLTGDLVYISDFTSLDPDTDETTIKLVNNINGHNIVKVSDTVFEIDGLDLTATNIVNPIIDQTLEIYFGANRIFVPMELTFIYSPD